MTETIIDISKYQHDTPIEYKKVFDAGVRGVIIEAKDEAGAVNPYFADDWRGFKAVGMGVGGYVFCRPDVEAEKQAADLLKILSFGGPAWADIEVNGFTIELERAILDKAPDVGTYVPGYMIEEHKAELWGPDPWTTKGSSLESKSVIVQVGTGTIPGISGRVDIDVWEHDTDAFLRTFKLKVPAPAKPAAELGTHFVDIVGCSTGGFWKVSDTGHVYAVDGAPYLGECNWTLEEPVAAMAACGPRGYWLLTEGGVAHPFGAAA